MSDSSTLGLLASIGMAIGAPLVYADQANSIAKRRNSEGFSKDVCAVLLIANIARVFWWFHERYELALLVQSILMIVSQFGLLSLVLRYQPGSFASSAYTSSSDDYRYSDPGPASARPTSRQQQQQGVQINIQPPTPEQENASRSFSRGQDSGSGAQSGSTDSNNVVGVLEYVQPSLRALFGGSSSSQGRSSGSGGRGRYVPVLGDFRMPTMPTLDTSGGFARVEDAEGDEEPEDTDPVSLPTRALRTGKRRLLQAWARAAPLIGVRNDGSLRADGSDSGRPFGFWTWRSLPSYIYFLVAYSLLHFVLQILLGRSDTYAFLLGLFALGLESALPVPQLLSNQRRKSLAGFRLSVLGGWLVGDAFKTVYFIINGSPVQFLAGGLFALSVDVAIVVQARLFQEQTQRDEEDERAAAEAARVEQGRTRRGGDGPEHHSGTSESQSRRQQQQQQQKQTQPASGPGRTKGTTMPEDPWNMEQADLDEDAVLFDSTSLVGGGGGGGNMDSGMKRDGVKGSSNNAQNGSAHQMFTIEADDDG